MTVPNFCKGCGNRLEGLEREVCSAKECLNFLRNTTAQLDPRKNVSREHLLKEMEQDIRLYEAVPDKDKDLGWLVKLENLTREVEAYPWDDCTLLAERHEALLREMLPLRKIAMTGKISDNRTISLPIRKDRTAYYMDTDTPNGERMSRIMEGDVAGPYGVPESYTPKAADWHKVGGIRCCTCGVEVRGNTHLCKGRKASQKFATWTLSQETWLYGKPNRPNSKLISVPAHATLLGTGRAEVHSLMDGSSSCGGEWLEVADDVGRPMGWIENVGLRRGPTIKICGEDEGELPLSEQEMYELRCALHDFTCLRARTLRPEEVLRSVEALTAILRKRGMTL